MKFLFDFFHSNSKLSIVITISFLVLGIINLSSLRRETRPPVDFARVIISTVYQGASPEEIEDQITRKIEEQIKSVDGLIDIRSVSSPGLSYIGTRIDLDNQDTQEVVDEIRRAVSRVRNLPEGVLDPPFITHVKAKIFPLFKVILTGSNEDRKRDKVAFRLKTLIESDPGVDSVSLSGYHSREFKVVIHPKKLIQHHISIEEVIQAVEAHTRDTSAGMIRSKTETRQVNFFGKIKNTSELKSIVVRSNFSGQKILLQDVGSVLDTQEDSKGLARFDGQPITFLLISKKEKADSIHLSNRIKKFIQNYSLPKDFNLRIFDNEADRTESQLNIVVNNAWLGLFLVLTVLFIMLPGWLGFLSALSLPVSILSAIIIFSAFDVTFNTITMLSFILCIGMLVDNSVVISENYARLRSEGLSVKESSSQSILQLYKPITATVLTTIVAFLPMLVVKGIMGQFIKWIPIIVCVALSMSLFDAFFLLPTRLKWAVKETKAKLGKVQSGFEQLSIRFESWISYLLKYKYTTFCTLFGIIIFSTSMNFWMNEFILFPKDDVTKYIISYETRLGSSAEKTDIQSQYLISQIIKTVGAKEIDGLLSYSGAGYSGIGTSGNPSNNSGNMLLILKTDSDYRHLPAVMIKKLRDINVSQFKSVYFRKRGGGPPIGDAVHAVFNSYSEDDLDKIAEEFQTKLREIPGVIEVKDNKINIGPQYNIYPNHKVLSQLRLSPQLLGRTLRASLGGAITGELVEDGESFYVRVYYDDEVRANIDQLKSVKILTPSGQLIPLGKVLTVEEDLDGSYFKKRYDFQPSVEVTASVNSLLINSEKANAKAEVMLNDLLKKYPSVTYKLLGEKRSSKESLDSLFQAMIVAVVGIFIILLIMFKGFLISLLSLSSILLGLIGVSVSFALHQRPLSFLALIGVVGLAGVTINSAIILLSFIENSKKRFPDRSLTQILSLASRQRLRPILITTFTTVVGLLPSAYGIGGFDPTLVPMTLAFTWGLTSGSLLTLVWIPCGYLIIEDIKVKLDSLVTRLRFQR